MDLLTRPKRLAGGPTTFLAVFWPALLFRRWTAGRRALPDVFLLGAPKGGTTSFAVYLAMHPCYVPAQSRELMFLQEFPNFVANHERSRALQRLWGRFDDGIDSYRKFFPLQRTMDRVSRRTGAKAITGDHTPFYLYCPVAAQRIRELCPQARFVILLRDPVSRAYSDFNMLCSVGWDHGRSFEQAIDDELSGACVDFRLTYLHQGIYEPHVRRWLEEFPPERFLIVDSRELFSEPASVVARSYDFLGLPAHEPGKLGVMNKGRRSEPMRPETRDRLREYFAPHNRALSELLGMDFSWS